jgi:hypothetical protein
VALDRLARDRDLRLAMGEAGRARVQEHFTRSGMAERHVQLYEQVMQGWAPYVAV